MRNRKNAAQLWAIQGKRAEARDLLAPNYGFAEGFDAPDPREARALPDDWPENGHHLRRLGA
jgi:hypothetical protein